MTPSEKKQIIQWNSQLSQEIRIHLIMTEDERSDEFSQFCEKLSHLSSNIRIVREKDESENIPAIHIHNSLHYQAIPLGTELEPFLEALSLSDHSSIRIPADIQTYLDKIRIPVELTLYVSPHCPFCPAMVRQLVPLSVANELIRLTIRDGFLFPEMAKSDNIQSAPTLLLDKDFRWTGTVNLKELAEVILNRDPAQLGASTLEAMLKEGNASQVAKMMREAKKIFPAFSVLLADEKWSVRLGAMTVMEELAETDKQLAAQIIPSLWESFHQANIQVMGDLLYILGEVGDREMIPMLETILNGDYHSEVKEAAKEGIEKIESEKF